MIDPTETFLPDPSLEDAVDSQYNLLGKKLWITVINSFSTSSTMMRTRIIIKWDLLATRFRSKTNLYK